MTERPPLMTRLLKLQDEAGYVSASAARELAEEYGIAPAQLYSLMSFFDGLRTRPAGRQDIRVCFGTACYEKGAPIIYERLRDELQIKPFTDTTEDGEVTVEQVYCLGACSRAPLLVINQVIHGRVKSHQVPVMVRKLDKAP